MRKIRLSGLAQGSVSPCDSMQPFLKPGNHQETNILDLQSV